MFLEIYPFCPVCPISWHIIVHSNFLQSFVFLWYQLLLLLFNFWFYLFRSFLFFSWWVWLKVCQFCLSFQRIGSWIHWSFEFFLDSMLFNSALILIISFLLLAMGFVVILLTLLDVGLGFLFEIFLSSLGRPVLLWTSLSELP